MISAINFFDDEWRPALLPLAHTRPLALMRWGICTIAEKWLMPLGNPRAGYLTERYLQVKFPLVSGAELMINGRIAPTHGLLQAVRALPQGTALRLQSGTLVAYRMKPGEVPNAHTTENAESTEFLPAEEHQPMQLKNPRQLFTELGKAIQYDFAHVTEGHTSQPIPASVTVIGSRTNVFLAPGAKVEACVLNTKEGPIYIGQDAEIMEGCLVRGPLVVGHHSTLKMGAKVYGPTAIGPHCKVGGEVSNSNIFGYSNKGHDGFLGNSVLGEWVNLGADTNTSNLKNNYGPVKQFSYATGHMENTGLQFCGLLAADHVKAGINTMFNTGTVVGVAANIFDGGFPPVHVPAFSWGGAHGFEPFRLGKAIEVAQRMMERRNVPFTQGDHAIFEHLHPHPEQLNGHGDKQAHAAHPPLS